ncbi:hypothetical protein BKA70DRAFT_1283256 [Coprinopsis sp. MPI-PUGE-AT-0042]|nr:hypothetical protein BKA70DRAFT_1283256 [Coprinopsis sp. MPI-PUGE-AT-0042]
MSRRQKCPQTRCRTTPIDLVTAWKSWTSCRSVGKHKSSFVTIVYRDGLVWYFVIMSISLINLLIWAVAPPALIQIAVSLLHNWETTIASRILLNIRGMLDCSYGTVSYYDTTQGQISTIGNQSTTGVGDPSSDVHLRSNSDYPLSTMKNQSKWDGEGR